MSDLITMVERRLNEAEQRGEQRILRQVAELPSPWQSSTRLPQCQCDWCGVIVEADGGYAMPPHTDTDCLWPRAQKAKEGL